MSKETAKTSGMSASLFFMKTIKDPAKKIDRTIMFVHEFYVLGKSLSILIFEMLF